MEDLRAQRHGSAAAWLGQEVPAPTAATGSEQAPAEDELYDENVPDWSAPEPTEPQECGAGETPSPAEDEAAFCARVLKDAGAASSASVPAAKTRAAPAQLPQVRPGDVDFLAELEPAFDAAFDDLQAPATRAR